MLNRSTYCILGAGTLGKTIIRGLLRTGQVRPDAIRATVGHQTSVDPTAAELGVALSTDNAAAARDADVVLLAVKPQKMEQALAPLRALDLSDKLIVTMAAGVSTTQVEGYLGQPATVVRAMPNTPCQLGEGMTGVTAGAHAGTDQVALAREIFDAVGRTVVVDEHLMDGVTALSASGPAYVFVVIESLAEFVVKLWLPSETYTLLAAQALKGAAQMVLELGAHPALLKDGVTPPAGCTIDGLLELEEGKQRVTLIKAVVTAAQRAAALG